MLQEVHIEGQLYSGLGKGSFFTQVDWVKKGVYQICGFEPFPGTLNLRVSKEDYDFVQSIRSQGSSLIPPDPNFCTARLLKANIQGIECAIVFPEESVWAHKDTLEIMAPLYIRKALGVEEGDIITVKIKRKVDPKTIIFDLDGTLIDSIQVFYELGDRIAQELGLPRPDREKMRLCMNHGKDPWEALIPGGVQEREKLLEKGLMLDRSLFKDTYLQNCRLFPWAKGLLWRLHEKGLRLAILTVGWELDLIQSLFEDAQIRLHEIISVIHSCAKKAQKDLALEQGILEISKAMGIKPWDCAYVADAVVNIEVGKRLKVFTIGTLTGIATREEMLQASADLIGSDAKAVLEVIGTN